MINWFSLNKKAIIRGAFLVPILLVAAISISHVVRWYSLANPLTWAIYLSIAIEIAAMSAIAASSVKVKGFSVWFVFIIVTLIQFIGNIFFCYTEIDESSKMFVDWSELSAPVFESLGSDISNTISQKRWLALLEGGLLPLISLTCLHFFIKYGDLDSVQPDLVLEKETEPEQTATIIKDNEFEEIKKDEEEPSSNTIDASDIVVESLGPVDPILPASTKSTPVPSNSTKYGISEKMKKIINQK